MGLSDPRGFVSDLGLQFFALGAGSALSLVRLLIACLRNCYKIFRLMPGFCCLVVAEGCRLYLMVAVSCFTRLFTNSTLACQSVFYRELLLRSGYSYRALPQSVLYSTGICATLPLLDSCLSIRFSTGNCCCAVDTATEHCLQSVLYSTGIWATLPLLTRREVVSADGPPEGGI